MSRFTARFVALGLTVAAAVLSMGSVQAQPVAARPEIAGVWVMAPGLDKPASLKPAAQAQREVNRASLAPGAVSLDPTAQCLPMGFPRNMATRFPIQIVQTPRQVTMIFQAGVRVRRVFTDGRAHNAERDPSYNGDSIGRWEGDTLVVETSNFKDGAWLDHDGTPHSKVLRAVERIRVVEQGRVLLDEITLFDENVLSDPWVKSRRYERAPGGLLSDYICVEHGKDNPAWASTDGAATLHHHR
jgi:hypothetical protein